MRITDIKVVAVACPTSKILQWGFYNSTNHIGAVIVQVETDAGLTGIGEGGSSFRDFGPIKLAIEQSLKPRLVGESPLEIERLARRMSPEHSLVYGSEAQAVSAIDIALWDLLGKVAGQPIYRLLGGYQTELVCYAAPSLGEPKVVERECAEFAEQGFKCIKLRTGLGVEVDLEIVRVARKVVGDAVKLAVDANMAYDFHTAVRMARRFEELGIVWFEEPVLARGVGNYVASLKQVRDSVGTLVAGGEHLAGHYEYVDLISQRAADIVQPDCTAAGGISEVKKIASMASACQAYCMPHVACSSVPAIGLAANLHVACSLTNHLYMEYPVYDTPLRQEFLVEPLVVRDGCLRVPDKPGLGIELNPAALRKYVYEG